MPGRFRIYPAAPSVVWIGSALGPSCRVVAVQSAANSSAKLFGAVWVVLGSRGSVVEPVTAAAITAAVYAVVSMPGTLLAPGRGE